MLCGPRCEKRPCSACCPSRAPCQGGRRGFKSRLPLQIQLGRTPGCRLCPTGRCLFRAAVRTGLRTGAADQLDDAGHGHALLVEGDGRVVLAHPLGRKQHPSRVQERERTRGKAPEKYPKDSPKGIRLPLGAHIYGGPAREQLRKVPRAPAKAVTDRRCGCPPIYGDVDHCRPIAHIYASAVANGSPGRPRRTGNSDTILYAPGVDLQVRRRLLDEMLATRLASGRFPLQRDLRLRNADHLDTIDEMVYHGFAAVYTPMGEDRPVIRPTIPGLALLDGEPVDGLCQAGDALLSGMRKAFATPDGDQKRWSINELAQEAGVPLAAVLPALPFVDELPGIWGLHPDPDGNTSGQLLEGILRAPNLSAAVARARARLSEQERLKQQADSQPTPPLSDKPTAQPPNDRKAKPSAARRMTQKRPPRPPKIPKNRALSTRHALKGTAIFISIVDLFSMDGPLVFAAMSALHRTLRAALDQEAGMRGVQVLSCLTGALLIVPDDARTEVTELLANLAPGMAAASVAVRVGVAHGDIAFLEDADGSVNGIGVCINTAARLANAKENPGLLVDESYARHIVGVLRDSHWLAPRNAHSLDIVGKRNEPFRCFAAPSGSFAALPSSTLIPPEETPPFVNLVLLAYDLPGFSSGDTREVTARFESLVGEVRRLKQNGTIPAGALVALSPGGDGAVLGLEALDPSVAPAIAEGLQRALRVESSQRSERTDVRARIALHYGPVFFYQSADASPRFTGPTLFRADELAADHDARLHSGSVVFSEAMIGPASLGSRGEAAIEFAEIGALAVPGGTPIRRFVRRTSPPQLPGPSPSSQAQDPSSKGVNHSPPPDPTIGTARATAWIREILNPWLAALERELPILRKGNPTWDPFMKKLTQIHPMSRAIASRRALEDLLKKRREYVRPIRQRDQLVAELEQLAAAASSELLARPGFAQLVLDKVKDYQDSGTKPNDPWGAYSPDKMATIVAEHVVNQDGEVGWPYTDREFWNRYRLDFLAHRTGPHFEKLDEAVHELAQTTKALRDLISNWHFDLCGTYGLDPTGDT